MTAVKVIDGVTWIRLPWDRPPLNLNQSLHYAVKARLVAEVRRDVGWLLRAAKLSTAEHVTVGLVYAPGDRRRRDEDNLVGLLKACCDAAVDVGLCVDDDPAHMTKLMPKILPPPAEPGLWLTVETT
jgi:crossover junction endodeoxyribonuclease RusA